MRALPRYAVLVLATILAPTQLQAQTPASAGLYVGRAVRLTRPGLGRIEGTVVAVQGDTVSLGVDAGETRVRLAEIDSVWVQRSGERRGMEVGALLGSVTFGVGVAATCGDPYNEYCVDFAGKLFVGALSSIVGMFVGGVLGASVGSAIPEWDLSFVTPHAR